MSAAEQDPFALNEDGTAKDPAAFRAALRADPVKMEALEKEPNVAAVVLGDDVAGFQELIKSIYQASKIGARDPAGHHRYQRRRRVTPGEKRAGVDPPSPPPPHLTMQAEKKRMEKINRSMSERTIDAQRVSGALARGGD